jgi:hypothetical protein
MIFALFSSGKVSRLVVLVSSWVAYQSAILFYGIATNQVGFILLFAFHIFATLFAALFSAERS